MSAPKFTPGPWKRPTDLGIVSTSAARINKNGRAIRQRVALLDCKGLDQVTIDANAALIAAAPELYEALERALPVLIAAAMNASSADTYKPPQQIALDMARAALAKVMQP